MFYSPLSGRLYASQHYREEANAVVITGAKYDVTNDMTPPAGDAPAHPVAMSQPDEEVAL